MNRSGLQILADVRVGDAEVLLQAQRWGAAYYLLGYAVECALKACVSKRFREHEVPERTVVNDFYTHGLDQHLKISGARAALDELASTDSTFAGNWHTVCDWSERSRYDHSVTEGKAREMFRAVTDPSSGVLPWLKTWW